MPAHKSVQAGPRRGYKQTEIGEIPVEWELKRLTDVCHESRLRNSKLEIDESLLSGVFKGLGLIPMKERVKGETVDRCKIVRPNAYAYNPMRINIGSIAKNERSIPVMVSPDYVVFAVDKSVLSHQYLDQFCRSPIWEEFMRTAGDGGVRIRIYFDHLKELLIPLPPLPEQKKIAEILSSLDAAIRSTQAVIDQARTLKKGLLGQLLTRGIGHKKYKQTEIGEIPVKWEVKTLGEVGNWSGGGTPSKKIAEYWINGTIPWVSSLEVKEQIQTETTYKITEMAVLESSAKMIPEGSLLMVMRSGILQHTFPVSLTVFPVAINQDIKALIPHAWIIPRFLLSVFEHLEEKVLRDCVKTGTTVQSVEFEWLKSIVIPLPPLPEQKQIAEILSGVDAVIRQNSDQVEQLKQTKSGLMQDLLTGRKRVAV